MLYESMKKVASYLFIIKIKIIINESIILFIITLRTPAVRSSSSPISDDIHSGIGVIKSQLRQSRAGKSHEALNGSMFYSSCAAFTN